MERTSRKPISAALLMRLRPFLAAAALSLLLFCGCAAPDLTPLPSAALSGEWVLLVRTAGPRWLGPAWWQAQGYTPDPQTLSLARAGEPEPFLWLDSPEGPGLLFLGQADSAYTLRAGAPGLLMSPYTASTAAPYQTTTLISQTWESDLVYRTTAPFASPWLWTTLSPAAPFELTLPLTAAVQSPVTLTLRVWGQSAMLESPDHHVRVLWNGVVVDDHRWDGNALETWTLTLPPVAEGRALLRLEVPGDTGAAAEVNWLDGVTATWQQALQVPATGWTRWQAGPETTACWEGSHAAHALFFTADGPRDGGAVTRQDGPVCLAQPIGAQGWIGAPEAAPPPDWARVREFAPELPTTDYVIVAPRAFHAALLPLLEARRAAGMTPALLTPEQVYDTFGDGRPTDVALRSMVQALSAGALRYLLLVGDTTPATEWVDPLTLPTGWVRTDVVGHTASDSALVGDFPVAVGRFPASTPAEVQAMVEKTLAWGDAQGPALLFAADDEAEFATLLDELATLRAPDWRVTAAASDARDGLVQRLSAGPTVLVYSGHGSLPMLADEKLLLTEDAGRWRGPTVVVAWTCLCASFAQPTHTGLAEAWMRAPRGVAAFVGPTGETTTAEQQAMALAFQRALIAGDPLGDALLAGWRAAASPDARASFLLLGDPALRPFAPQGD